MILIYVLFGITFLVALSGLLVSLLIVNVLFPAVRQTMVDILQRELKVLGTMEKMKLVLRYSEGIDIDNDAQVNLYQTTAESAESQVKSKLNETPLKSN